jgi:branched-chain amino acid transport system substrate-binding protein
MMRIQPERRGRRAASWAAGLALALAPAVGPGGAGAAAPGPIKLGASLSLTGTYASLGQNQQRGYQLCVKLVNERGGVLGRKIEVHFYDDKSDPATGARLYEQLIARDKMDVVLGPYSSDVTDVVANTTEQYKVPMVSPLAATTSIFKKGRKYIFMVLAPAEQYLEGLIEIGAAKGLKTVAILNEDSLFPRATAQGTMVLAKKKGMQVVLQEAYPRGNTDFSALLSKVRAANPDILAAATYFGDAVAITRQMKESNVNPKMYGVTVGGDLPRFYELLGKSAEYIYGATQWEPDLHFPGAKEFTEAHRKEFPGAGLSYHSAAGYAGCQLLVEAVRRAGSTDGEKVREALLKLETKTMFGPYKVDQDGFQVAKGGVLFQWQDGKKVMVFPDDVATGKPRFPTPHWNRR